MNDVKKTKIEDFEKSEELPSLLEKKIVFKEGPILVFRDMESDIYFLEKNKDYDGWDGMSFKEVERFLNKIMSSVVRDVKMVHLQKRFFQCVQSYSYDEIMNALDTLGKKKEEP